INTAVGTYSVSTDMDGQSRSDLDVGADEFSSATVTQEALMAADVGPSADLGPVATPSFNPAGGVYATAQSVAITSSTGSATIRFTTDGSTPTQTNGIIYSGPVTISAATTVKAIAYKTGMDDSPVATA